MKVEGRTGGDPLRKIFPLSSWKKLTHHGPTAGEEAFGQVVDQEDPVVARGPEVAVLLPLAPGTHNRRPQEV